jgi:hypothetical protein
MARFTPHRRTAAPPHRRTAAPPERRSVRTNRPARVPVVVPKVTGVPCQVEQNLTSGWRTIVTASFRVMEFGGGQLRRKDAGEITVIEPAVDAAWQRSRPR